MSIAGQASRRKCRFPESGSPLAGRDGLRAAPGAYRLVAIHDDGLRLWIDGQEIIDKWGKWGKETVPVQFNGRLQTLKVEFCQREGPATIGLGWIAPGATKPKAIPESAYFHEPIPPGPVIVPYTRPDADGRVRLNWDVATVHGPGIGYSDAADHESVAYWTDIGDWVHWDFDAAEGDYAVNIEYSCKGKSAGSTYVLSVGTNRLAGIVTGTAGWESYDTIRLGQVHLGPGLQSLRIKPTAKPGEAVMNLRGVILTPIKTGT